MAGTTLRRSCRIKSLSEDEASVASSTRSREPTPRRSTTVDRAGKRKSSTEKIAKKKKLVAIPEAIDIAGSGLKDEKMTETSVESNTIGHAKIDDAAKEDIDYVTVPTSINNRKKKGRRNQSTLPEEEDKKKSDCKQSILPEEEVAEDSSTPNPANEKATIGTQKILGKNALKKLKRKQGINAQIDVKIEASSPSVPVSSKKKKNSLKKKLTEDELVDEVAADSQVTTTTTVSKKKRTNMAFSELNPKASDAPKTKKKRKLSKEYSKLDDAVKGKSLPQQTPSVKKNRPVLDVKIHRMRFLKLQQRAIISMSSTPLLPASSAGIISSRPNLHHPGRLAISREGGSVELLSPNDRWVAVGDIPGVRGREVDAMVWICGAHCVKDDTVAKISGGNKDTSIGQREAHCCRLVDEKMHLFGCSRDGTIFELDFATKRQKGVIGSGGGGVFCMTSLCSRGGCCGSRGNDGRSSSGSCGGYFAAGCEDGTVKVFTAFGSSGGGTASDDPTLVATLPSAGNAILSLAWLPGHSGRDDGGMDGSVIFAGVADGSIRRFDCTSSITTGPISTGSTIALSKGSVSMSYRWKSSLRMTVENRGLSEATKVWALKALTDGTVISGDSLGHVQIWDGVSGTMTQSFDHNENGADVLCLAVSEDENKIFASGIDSSVRCVERQSLSGSSDSGQDVMNDSIPVRKWISSISHRKHSHDVRALAICHKEYKSKSLELLVSGSVDTRICSYVANDFKISRPKVWYNWPSRSPISISCRLRLLAVTRDNRIDLYQLAGPDMVDPSKIMCPEARDESKSLVKTILINSPYNLCCSTISDDGKFLAASDAISLYVFSLEVEDEDGILDVRPARLDLSGVCKHPATALKFDHKERLICASIEGPINILKISSALETESGGSHSYSVSLEHVFKEHIVGWSCTSHHFPIVNLDLSFDGKRLSAGRFSSDKGSVHVFTLSISDGVGRNRHWWALPVMDATTTCIKFLGGNDTDASLAVGCSTNEFYIFNLDRRALSHWSNDMGLPPLKSLPKELTSRSEPLTRIVSNPAEPQCFILVSVFVQINASFHQLQYSKHFLCPHFIVIKGIAWIFLCS